MTLTRTTTAPGLTGYATEAAILAARRRLQLQYPQQHTLQLTEAAGQVQVHLTIQLA